MVKKSTRRRAKARKTRRNRSRKVRSNVSKRTLFAMARATAAKRSRKKKAPKRARRRARLSKFFSAREHRPRVRIIRGKGLEIFRPRSPYKGVITKANPRKGRKMKHRSNRTRRNPMALARVGINKAWIMNAVMAGAGFAVAIKGTKYLYNIPQVEKFNKFIGILHVLIGGFVAVKVNKPAVKAMAGGFAAAGVVDLLAKNLPVGIPTLLGMDHEVVLGLDHVAGETYGEEDFQPSYANSYAGEDDEMGSSY